MQLLGCLGSKCRLAASCAGVMRLNRSFGEVPPARNRTWVYRRRCQESPVLERGSRRRRRGEDSRDFRLFRGYLGSRSRLLPKRAGRRPRTSCWRSQAGVPATRWRCTAARRHTRDGRVRGGRPMRRRRAFERSYPRSASSARASATRGADAVRVIAEIHETRHDGCRRTGRCVGVLATLSESLGVKAVRRPVKRRRTARFVRPLGL